MSIKAEIIFLPENYTDAEEVEFAVSQWRDTGDLSFISDLVLDLEEVEVKVQ